jgi:hypothetical protein
LLSVLNKIQFEKYNENLTQHILIETISDGKNADISTLVMEYLQSPKYPVLKPARVSWCSGGE